MKKLDYTIIFIERLKEAHSKGGYLDVREIALRENIPGAFLEKIAQDLKRAGWVASKRGFGGGYRLAVSPDKISVSELISFYRWPARACPLVRKGL